MHTRRAVKIRTGICGQCGLKYVTCITQFCCFTTDAWSATDGTAVSIITCRVRIGKYSR